VVFGENSCSAWGTKAKEPHFVRKIVVVWPCRLRRQGQKTILFWKMYGFCPWYPRPPKNTWPKKHFAIPLMRYLTVQKIGLCSKHQETGPKLIGLGLCRFAGIAPGILGLVLFGVWADLGPKSAIPGRILRRVRGPFRSAELLSCSPPHPIPLPKAAGSALKRR
jgi:hypothetical protein